MHHTLFPPNLQTATFCSYKDDNESESRWMSDGATSLCPALQPSRWSCSLCHVCLLALAVAWVIALNMKSKTDEARAHTSKHILTNTHPHQPAVYIRSISSSECSCSQRRWDILGAASPLQWLHYWIAGTEGWINRKSMWLHGQRMQGCFPNYGKCRS